MKSEAFILNLLGFSDNSTERMKLCAWRSGCQLALEKPGQDSLDLEVACQGGVTGPGGSILKHSYSVAVQGITSSYVEEDNCLIDYHQH